MAEGYIALCNPDWFLFQLENSESVVVFWRKESDKERKILTPGMPFFFLPRCYEGEKATDRIVGGYGTYVTQGRASISEVWDRHGTRTGAATIEELLEMAGFPSTRSKGAYYRIDDVKYFSNPISPADVGVPVRSTVQLGKAIDDEETVQKLIEIGTQDGPGYVKARADRNAATAKAEADKESAKAARKAEREAKKAAKAAEAAAKAAAAPAEAPAEAVVETKADDLPTTNVADADYWSSDQLELDAPEQPEVTPASFENAPTEELPPVEDGPTEEIPAIDTGDQPTA
jgi:hypothetical protein